MANELQSDSFYKPNVLAMLNTLFPPSMKDMPNDRIDIKALQKYRATFYQHILTVEAKGTGVVKEFVQQLLKPEAKHSWTSARANLERYIDLADLMIQQGKAVQGVDGVRGIERDSLRHSRTVSVANSAFSERPSTASSANTSLDGHMPALSGPKSPSIPVASGIPKPKGSGRSRISNSADAAIIFAPHPPSPSLAPRPLQLGTSNTPGNPPNTTRGLHTPLSAVSSPPTKPIPPLPRNKADVHDTSRSFSAFDPRNPDVHRLSQPPSPGRSEKSRNKSHSVPVPKPSTHPRVASKGTKQSTPKSPLSSAFIPDEVSSLARPGSSSSRPYTPTLTSKEKEFQSDDFEFLKHPFNPSEQPEATPTLKKKSSKTNIFQRRKGSDASSAKGSGALLSILPFKSPKKTDPFPQYSESEAETQGGKPRKKKSQRSLRNSESGRPSDDMQRSATWTEEGGSDAMQSKSTLAKSKTWADGSHSEAEAPKLKKNKSAQKLWSNSIGRAFKGRKSSPRKIEFNPEEYEIAPPEPAFHFPSAPNSPITGTFGAQVDPPNTLRRTKSHDRRSTAKTAKTPPRRDSKDPPPGFYSADAQQRAKDHRDIHVDRLITSTNLVEELPSSLSNLPLDEKYDVTRAREYTRKALIEKARAEKYDFEKPRAAPVPQTRKRGPEFAREVGWVPFEQPRATPKPPEKKEIPPKTKYYQPDVSRFST